MSFLSPLNVLVIDDHVGIRTGIAGLIDAEAPTMRTVGLAATGAEALSRMHELRPDVVVLDADLDGEDGLALLPALHAIAACEVVVLTSLLDPLVAVRALALGACACLQKTAPAAELVATLSRIADAQLRYGDVLSAPSLAGGALSHSHGTKHP